MNALFAEDAATDFLVAAGWRILGQRVQTPTGQLDVVARRGDVIVFVVTEPAPNAAVRQRVRRSAVAWMSRNPRLQRGVRRYRFDVVTEREGVMVVVPDAF